jgi:hypothetical protein
MSGKIPILDKTLPRKKVVHIPKGPFRIRIMPGRKGFSLRAGGCEVARIPASYGTLAERYAMARLFAHAPALLVHADLLDRTLEYYIRKDENTGDQEGANLKGFTRAQVVQTLNAIRGEA